MKRLIVLMLSVCCTGLAAAPVSADAPRTVDELLDRAKADRLLERKIDTERETQFVAERDKQKERLAAAKRRLDAERARNQKLTKTFDKNTEQLEALRKRLEDRSADLGELFGTVRQMAAESAGILKSSLVSAQYPGRARLALTLADSKELPSIEALERFWHAMLDEMAAGGKVTPFTTTIITNNGTEKETEVVRVGAFNAVSDGRFLRYLPESAKLVALSRQPGTRFQVMANDLQQAGGGETVDMALDPSRGAILALLVRSPTLRERVQQGGWIGYFILALGALGLLIVLERMVMLTFIGRRVKKQQTQPEKPRGDNPLGRLLKVYREHTRLEQAKKDAESLVLRLEEIVQQELSRLRRGLGTLVVLATISPLLGLLGTVTGMIATFQSIALFGTGDPKLMSGGISQALVTTELGLAVAIPLMLLHTLLSGKSRKLIQVLDERSIALVAEKVEAGGA